MIIELIEEKKPSTGTMYAIVADGQEKKWFAVKEVAEKFYKDVIADPSILETQRNILFSQEINVPLEEIKSENT